MGEVVLEHGGAGGAAQGDGLGDLGRDAGADGAARAHEAVDVRGELREQQVQALQAGRGAHEVAVVEGEHDGVAALGVEDVRQVLLHAPVKAVGTLDVEALAVGEGSVNVVVLRNLDAIEVCHVCPFSCPVRRGRARPGARKGPDLSAHDATSRGAEYPRAGGSTGSCRRRGKGETT